MKRLGNTDLHRLVATETSNTWTKAGHNEAESYFLFRQHGIDTSDIARELGIDVFDKNHIYLLNHILEHPPTAVLAAFDQVRQNELDAVQGAPVSIEITHRELEFLHRFLQHAYSQMKTDDWEQIHVSERAIEQTLDEIDKLRVSPIRRGNP